MVECFWNLLCSGSWKGDFTQYLIWGCQGLLWGIEKVKRFKLCPGSFTFSFQCLLENTVFLQGNVNLIVINHCKYWESKELIVSTVQNPSRQSLTLIFTHTGQDTQMIPNGSALLTSVNVGLYKLLSEINGAIAGYTQGISLSEFKYTQEPFTDECFNFLCEDFILMHFF